MASNPLGLRANERVSLFVDGPNLYGTVKTLGADLDYRTLLATVGDNLVRAHYYTALPEGDEGVVRKLVHWLDYNGWTVCHKPLREYSDELGRRRQKSSMQVEIACDMLETASHYDHAILFSGDGDLKAAVAALQRKGNRVSVVSSMRPAMISDDLRRQCDRFIDLSDIIEIIGRRDRAA